jgi:hypothetical protein
MIIVAGVKEVEVEAMTMMMMVEEEATMMIKL